MKLVVIENAFRLPDNVDRFIKQMQPEEVKIFNNFEHCDKSTLPAALMWCDTLLTETTLIKTYQIDDMVEMMEKLLSKQIVFTWEDTVNRLYEYLKDENDIVKVSHHKIGYYSYTFQLQDDAEPIINSTLFADNAVIVREKLRVEAELLALKLEQEKQYRDTAINRSTGQQVLIKQVQACGKEWSNLIPGNVVPALDMSEQDPRSTRGVWVMGLTEPVKLLNDSGYDEYELVATEDTDIDDIAKEILKMVGWFEIKKSDVYAVIGFIEEALSLPLEERRAQLHWNLTAWLDDNSIERRGHRNKIEIYLQKMLQSRLPVKETVEQ